MQQLTRQLSPHRLRCPLCRDHLDLAPRSTCRGCQTAYHSACSRELGGCSTLGCTRRSRRPTPDRKERTLDIPAWRRAALRRETERLAENTRRWQAWQARSGRREWIHGVALAGLGVCLVLTWIWELLPGTPSSGWLVVGVVCAVLAHLLADKVEPVHPHLLPVDDADRTDG